jgi:hypothetical protein
VEEEQVEEEAGGAEAEGGPGREDCGGGGGGGVTGGAGAGVAGHGEGRESPLKAGAGRCWQAGRGDQRCARELGIGDDGGLG